MIVGLFLTMWFVLTYLNIISNANPLIHGYITGVEEIRILEYVVYDPTIVSSGHASRLEGKHF